MNENKILCLLTIKVSGCRLTADGRPMGEKTEGKLGNIHPVVNITVITDAWHYAMAIRTFCQI